MAQSDLPTLRLLRRVCLAVGVTLDDERAVALERVGLVLGRMITDLSALPAIDEKRDRGVAAAVDPLAALKHEHQRWQDYEAAAAAELERSRHPKDTPEDKDDTIDVAKLEQFLRSSFPDETNLRITTVDVASRGFSKKTLLVGLGGTELLPDAVAVRMDQAQNYLGTLVVDEYPVLQHLWQHGVRLPEPLALELSGSVLGHPFIVSRKADGRTIGTLYSFPPGDDAVVADMASCMATLHGVPLAGFPGAELGMQDNRSTLRQEIAKYEGDWAALNIRQPIIEAAFAWIRRNEADGYGPPCLVHNDYGFNNILIEHRRVSAVLDWEFLHIGTRAADVGYFYYPAEAVSTYDAFLKAYVEAGGTLPPKAALDFYILWGQLRLAVMGFQVDTGFNEGQFDDIRFALSGAVTLRKAVLRVSGKLLQLLEQEQQ